MNLMLPNYVHLLPMPRCSFLPITIESINLFDNLIQFDIINLTMKVLKLKIKIDFFS